MLPMTEPQSTARLEQADTATPSGWCGSTDWYMLHQAAQGDCQGAAEALEELCRRYWPPVYAYIRRRGYEACQAEDLTQSFIASFLQTRVLAGLNAAKGRFRSFLLVSVKNFLANEWERSHARKRGGGRPLVSLDALAEEEHFCAATPALSPDALYDKRWALTILGQALRSLREQEIKAGRGVQFDHLHLLLTGGEVEPNYEAVGAVLGMTPEAVAMAVHRLRLRFREAVRMHIAATVRPEQVEEEIRCLKAALRTT